MSLSNPPRIDVTRIGYRVCANVAKWNDGRTPDDGDPDEIIEACQWYDQAMQPIEDSEWIADLEAAYRREHGDG